MTQQRAYFVLVLRNILDYLHDVYDFLHVAERLAFDFAGRNALRHAKVFRSKCIVTR